LMGGAYLRSRIKQAGKWDQETIVSFFLCQYCSGEYLRRNHRNTYACTFKDSPKTRFDILHGLYGLLGTRMTQKHFTHLHFFANECGKVNQNAYLIRTQLSRFGVYST
ncbi:hypothetical protein, partial [Aeromonas caviae]|uniref:hypothetical protein n=1 Tax=Aeromonas caviae TaxID=648 RepID=UPI001CC7FC8F